MIATAIEEAREKLAVHPLYSELTSVERVRIFMKHHVFAVWDFFSLLKRLQVEVTCVSVPWLPRGLGDHARFITEIVLAEECDRGPGGEYLSHFELYRAAMEEMGSDQAPIAGLIERIHAGGDPREALEHPEIPATAREFVGQTLRLAGEGELHEVAASFCHGRENLLPDVLAGARDGMTAVLAEAPTLAHYLDRHITLDHDEHGPLALRLLDAACAGDAGRIERANEVGLEAIEARGRLWDGVLEEIRQSGG